MTTQSADIPMSPIERQLLLDATEGARTRLSVFSDTRIDVGLWWRRTRLWLCVTDQDVVVLAASRRHYVERVAIADCHGSHYCHTTGELVVNAADRLRFNRLKLSPTDALQVLAILEEDPSLPNSISPENSRA